MIETIGFILTGIGLTASIVYYANVLANANKTRKAQLFMSIYKETQTKEAQTDFLDFAKIEMNNTEDWLKLQEDRKLWVILAKQLSYYEGIGVLVREGLIDIGLVARLSSGSILEFWGRFGDGCKELREFYNWPRWAIEVEYLSDQINAYSKKHPELKIKASERL